MLLRPKFLSSLLIWTFIALVASSCGLKGPLYRPNEPAETVTPVEDPSATKKKQGEPSVQPPDPDRPAVPPGPVPPGR